MLVVENISKHFGGIKALDQINLEIRAGEVTAIIGENGAGKSTLMKILSGVYPDYEGKVIFNGKTVNFDNPKQAQECGISIIHQELNLIPYLSVTENIFLGREITTSWGELDKKAMRLKTQSLLDRLKLNVNPDTLIIDIKVGQQQVVEIAKALLTESEVIIMDEPTSAISDNEVKVLFEIINDLRKENKAIVYISHKLDELFKIADRYIILRDGCVIESGNIQEMNADDVIHKMVGREVQMIRKQSLKVTTGELFSVKNLCLRNPNQKQEYLLKNISFNLAKGEILGVFGLMGAGRTELLEAIFGLHPKYRSGEVRISGSATSINCAADAIKAGLALVPEDRKKDGLLLDLDVQKNIGITTLKDMEHLGMLEIQKETQLCDKYRSELKIKTSSGKQTAGDLSGGNQQKIVIAKWLATHPKILLLDEPTRGIDVNAKNEIYKLILSLADKGMGIIMVSSELPEILAISDRVMVMSEGIITAQIPINEANEACILKAAIPKSI
ncbi:sugar ABC transporter ATP-binding protein [Pedobacter nyackensis]|uniref:Monosaccharide ABC transporter ATP-binding protein, CUT2 family n=1 Tax=Pedobacter nyackensis TaxID=475255 RepID=A0A1W2CPW4_9SPHI|nr:sugar ABC transporter ATP-binding protein [Pedobacter nyackensis]SMC87241.1 monosaccharide ABC transporter ATP-binding protein, CUT2 family [Pedobacter nyackensis]